MKMSMKKSKMDIRGCQHSNMSLVRSKVTMTVGASTRRSCRSMSLSTLWLLVILFVETAGHMASRADSLNAMQKLNQKLSLASILNKSNKNHNHIRSMDASKTSYRFLKVRGGGTGTGTKEEGIEEEEDGFLIVNNSEKKKLSSFDIENMDNKNIDDYDRLKRIQNYISNHSSRGGGKSKAQKNNTKQQNKHGKMSFPIQLSEFPQFACMSIMMFLFIYVFTTVRDTKDTLVVSNCGAEAIPFLKLYAVMPSAFLFIMCYSRLSNILGKRALFYATLLPFFLFYGAFAFFLFPNRNILHFIPSSGTTTGQGGTAITNLFRYWSFSLYFVVSELWASASIPLLFWQCANDVTNLSEAKRFYPLFAVTGNLAPIVSGKVMSYIVSLQKTNDDIGFGVTLKKLAIIKLSICVGIITLYNVIYSMANHRHSKLQKDTPTSKPISKNNFKGAAVNTKDKLIQTKKKKATLGESMKELVRSKELQSMATMVLGYNICIELTEVLWKGLLRKKFNNKSDYMAYMASFSQRVGTIAFVLQLLASEIIHILGWKYAALITPMCMFVLAIPFFFSVAFGERFNIPLSTALVIGTWQNVISKVTKYSLFDPCKEMAYIPLGPEAKVKGKAAVDVMGARLGRSIGSASQQLLVLLVGNGSILNCAPYLSILYGVSVGFWTRAVSILGKLFVDDQELEENCTTKASVTDKKKDVLFSIKTFKRGASKSKITTKI